MTGPENTWVRRPLWSPDPPVLGPSFAHVTEWSLFMWPAGLGWIDVEEFQEIVLYGSWNWNVVVSPRCRRRWARLSVGRTGRRRRPRPGRWPSNGLVEMALSNGLVKWLVMMSLTVVAGGDGRDRVGGDLPSAGDRHGPGRPLVATGGPDRR